MTKQLRISDSIALPLEAVTSTFGILAVRGAGKSNAGAVMAEEMFTAGLPFVAIDPVGSWPGLRSGSDGAPAGGLAIPIFGGRHGDVPLERGAGELVADLIAEQRLSCVLDLSEFASEGDKKAFLLAFARRLYQKNRDPLHLFLEEADDYIPQRPMRDEAQLLRAWENIVRRGRSRGLGCTLITQRSASLAKMVLTQVETLFVLRTTGPQDIAAIEAWVQYHQVGKEMLGTLAGLDDGEAWVWSPHFLGKTERFRFRRRRTFDTGATPKNVRGKEARKVATLADVDLDALKGSMAATIEKAKQDDPKELRKQLAAKDRRIADLERAKPAATKVERVEVPMFDQKAFDEMLSDLRNEFRGWADVSAKNLVGIANTYASKCLESNGARSGLGGTPRRIDIPRAEPQAAPANTPRRVSYSTASGSIVHRDPKPTNGEAHIGKGERAILTAIAQHRNGVTREQLTVLTGYKRSSRDTYLQRLTTAGLCEQHGDRIEATSAAVDVLGHGFEPLPTGRALLDYWLGRLTGGERKVLEAIAQSHPVPLHKTEIDESTGYKRSSRDTYLQRLSTRKLIRDDGPGSVGLSPELDT